MQGNQSNLVGHTRPGGGDHSPFGSRQILGIVEAESAGVADGADLLPLKLRAQGVSGIIEQPDSGPLGQSHESIHPQWQSGDMNGKQRFGSPGNLFPRLIRRHIQGVIVNIAVDRSRAGIEDRFAGGGEGIRSRNNLISRPDPRRLKHQVHRGGAGIDGDGIPGGQVLGYPILQEPGLGTGRDPMAPNRIGDFGHLQPTE